MLLLLARSGGGKLLPSTANKEFCPWRKTKVLIGRWNNIPIFALFTYICSFYIYLVSIHTDSSSLLVLKKLLIIACWFFFNFCMLHWVLRRVILFDRCSWLRSFTKTFAPMVLGSCKKRWAVGDFVHFHSCLPIYLGILWEGVQLILLSQCWFWWWW